MRRMTGYLAKTALVAALMCPAVVQAQTANSIPPGDQEISYRISDGVIYTPEEVRHQTRGLEKPLTFNYSGNGQASAITSPHGRPFVAVSAASSSSTTSTYVNARAAMGYWLYLDGPERTFDIPLLFTASLTANANGIDINGNEGASATALFRLTQFSGNPEIDANSYLGDLYNLSATAQNRYGSAGESSSSTVIDIANVRAGSYVGVLLIAEARTQNGGLASAYADPYFWIDPAFAAANPGYSLTFSPFAGNDAPLSSVPEPATWAMMILGFGAIGAALRRRRPATRFA